MKMHPMRARCWLLNNQSAFVHCTLNGHIVLARYNKINNLLIGTVCALQWLFLPKETDWPGSKLPGHFLCSRSFESLGEMMIEQVQARAQPWRHSHARAVSSRRRQSL
jgi:hypothetical protein